MKNLWVGCKGIGMKSKNPNIHKIKVMSKKQLKLYDFYDEIALFWENYLFANEQ